MYTVLLHEWSTRLKNLEGITYREDTSTSESQKWYAMLNCLHCFLSIRRILLRLFYFMFVSVARPLFDFLLFSWDFVLSNLFSQQHIYVVINTFQIKLLNLQCFNFTIWFWRFMVIARWFYHFYLWYQFNWKWFMKKRKNPRLIPNFFTSWFNFSSTKM